MPARRKVSLGKVALNVNTLVDLDSGPERRYLAGEHIDEGDLEVERWGLTTDDNFPPTFKRWFESGETLLHSRNPKKVAVPRFAGVTGEKLFVLRPVDSGELDPELLPFVLQSARFRRFLSGAVRGSVNKYLNWGQLSQFEFELPARDDQARIAAVLKASDRVWMSHRRAADAARRAIDALLERMLASEEWARLPCEKVLVQPPRNGVSVTANGDRNGFPTLSIGAVQRGEVLTDGFVKWAELPPDRLEKYRLRRDDVLVVRGNGNKNLMGRCGLVRRVPENCFYPDLLIRLLFDSARMLPAFGALQWNSPRVQRALNSRAKSTNGIWKVNGKDVRRQVLAVPPVEEQQALLREIESVRNLLDAAANRQLESRALHNALIDDLIG
jgi:type I restriction enzyme, S subunit